MLFPLQNKRLAMGLSWPLKTTKAKFWNEQKAVKDKDDRLNFARMRKLVGNMSGFKTKPKLSTKAIFSPLMWSLVLKFHPNFNFLCSIAPIVTIASFTRVYVHPCTETRPTVFTPAFIPPVRVFSSWTL